MNRLLFALAVLFSFSGAVTTLSGGKSYPNVSGANPCTTTPCTIGTGKIVRDSVTTSLQNQINAIIDTGGTPLAVVKATISESLTVIRTGFSDYSLQLRAISQHLSGNDTIHGTLTDSGAFRAISTSRFDSRIGVGGASNSALVMYITGSGLTSTSTQNVVYTDYTFSTAGTTQASGYVSEVGTAAGTAKFAQVNGFLAKNAVLGSGDTTTDQSGFRAFDQNNGTNNYGFRSDESAGAGKYAFYGAGTAASYFGGALDMADTGSSSTGFRAPIFNTTGNSAGGTGVPTFGSSPCATGAVTYIPHLFKGEAGYVPWCKP